MVDDQARTLPRNTIQHGDALAVLATLPDTSVQMICTSPPYFALRDYSIPPTAWPTVTYYAMPGMTQESTTHVEPMTCCLGLEPTVEAYVGHLVLIFRDLRRVLRDDGICWLNLGDAYANDRKWGGRSSGKNATSAAGGYQGQRLRRQTGLKPKDLIGAPWRVAFALQADGWVLRADVVLAKANPMPERVTDRPTHTHEYLFLLTKASATTYWTHRDQARGSRTAPAPDWRWIDRATGTEIGDEPADWRDQHRAASNVTNLTRWRRINLWATHDYYFDAAAIRERRTSRVAKRKQSQDAGTSKGNNLIPPADGRPDENETAGNSPYMREHSNSSATRNRRSVWFLASEPVPDAHFAAFPTALVLPCVLAGSSPRACEICGAPWQRMVERTFIPQEDVSGARGARGRVKPLDASNRWQGFPRGSTAIWSTGWGPTCPCAANHGTGRCVVLDPFGGTGTSACGRAGARP